MLSTEFESELLDNDASVAYFWSVNCQKCKIFGPIIESIMKTKGIALIKIDVGVEQDVALHYTVLSLPTLIFFRKGREELRLTASSITVAEIDKASERIT